MTRLHEKLPLQSPPSVGPLNYEPTSPGGTSGKAVVSLTLFFIQIPLALIASFLFSMFLTFDRDPSGDAGGPLFIVPFLLLLVAVPGVTLLLWLAGLTLATFALKDKGSCRLATVSLLCHSAIFVVMLIVLTYLWLTVK